MNKKIKQFRFPETLLEDNFFTEDGWSLNLIENLGPVTQLGIYALPGSRFKINQKQSSSVEELVINGHGVFSIDLEEHPLTSISIHKESYNNAKNNNHFIIIDVLYIPRGLG